MGRALLASDRFFGALLHLYPKEYRATYARQMRLTFRDACRAAYQRDGAGGLLALWLPTLIDLCKSALEERVRQGEFTMSKPRLIALAGPLTILAGAMWVVAFMGDLVLLPGLGGGNGFWSNFWEEFFLFTIILSFVPLLFALIGTRLRIRQTAGFFSRLGLSISVVGCAGMIAAALTRQILANAPTDILGQNPWISVLMDACLLVLLIGYTMFGVDNLRHRQLPRWNLLPLAAGSTFVYWLAALLLWMPGDKLLQLLPIFITGACWVLLGIAMIDPKQVPQPTNLSL